MEALSTLLEHIKKQGLAKGNLLGFLHVLIGRRTLAAPSDGDVACTRMPPISFSIMTMSPGVMSIFSSISSRASTSTRIG